MNTLKIFMGALLIFLASSGIQAQEDKPKQGPRHQHEQLTPEERAEEKTKRMTEQLGLTAEQATKVQKINLDHFKNLEAMRAEKRAQMKKLMEEKRAQKMEMKKQMKEEKEKVKASVDALLTDEQKKKRDELRQQNCPCCPHDK